MTSGVHRPELDGLRGLAILLVLVWHYGNFIAVDKGSLGYDALALFRMSWTGVDLFFVLSGFLIGGILIDNRPCENYWTTFYIRRICRIFPLYFAILFAFILFETFDADRFDWLLKGAMPTWSYASFLQNFVMADRSSFGASFMGPTWSLAVEEQFYLVLPFLVWLTPPSRLPWLLAFLVVCAPIARMIAWHWFSARHILASYVLTPCRADALLIGVLCAWTTRQKKLEFFLRDHPLLIGSVVAFLLAGFIALGYQYESFYAKGVIFFGFTEIALFYGVVLLISTHNRYAKFILSTYWLRQLGKIAFGVYLLHLPIAGLTHAVLLGQEPVVKSLTDGTATLLALFLTLLLACLSWRFFELRFIEIGKRFEYKNDHLDEENDALIAAAASR